MVKNRRADKPGSGWTREQVSDLLFAGFLGVVIGGRVGYVIFYNFDLFLADLLLIQSLDWRHVIPWWLARCYHRLVLVRNKNGRTFIGVADFVALGMGCHLAPVWGVWVTS